MRAHARRVARAARAASSRAHVASTSASSAPGATTKTTTGIEIVGTRRRGLGIAASSSSRAAFSAARGFAAAATGGGGGQGPVGWKSLAVACVTGGGLLYVYGEQRNKRLAAIKEGPSAGKASIGGHFTLKCANENGKAFSTTSLRGKFALLYFGFTMCPDICPDELEKMAECVDHVAAAGKEIVPVFVSIDPERDTVKRVKEYVKEFHPKLIGLTGSVDACKNAAKKYRVYYHKTGEEDDADYLVDHSIIMYLVDDNGDFVTFYGKNFEAKAMADAILEQMKRLGR